jgi:hypothetical protein
VTANGQSRKSGEVHSPLPIRYSPAAVGLRALR